MAVAAHVVDEEADVLGKLVDGLGPAVGRAEPAVVEDEGGARAVELVPDVDVVGADGGDGAPPLAVPQYGFRQAWAESNGSLGHCQKCQR